MLKRLALCAAICSLALPAYAADLGGNCCADLEERVAELEATAARKGNRKMSVIITGQVNYAYLGLSGTGIPSHENGVVMNSASPTFLGIEGNAKLQNGWAAGFRIELGMDDRLNLTTANLAIPNEVTMRVAVGYVDTPVGKITIGHGSMASDGAGAVTVANTAVASRMLSSTPLGDVVAFGGDSPYNDIRRDSIRYDSPSLAGFMISGSVGNGDNPLLGFAAKDAWDIAIRYAGELGKEFRIAGAIAYRDEQQSLTLTPFLPWTRSSVWVGSGSVMYMPLGLFVNVAAGQVNNDAVFGTFENYQAQAGIEKAFTSVGATTLFGEYADVHIDATGKSINMWGLGAVQNIAGLATDVYADAKFYDGNPLVGGPNASFQQYMLGVRVKF